jgi:hypothetical protein
MKNLQDYLYDKNKTYQFIIKVADSLDSTQHSAMKIALEKFQIVKMSEGKTTPIQAAPPCFPNLQNVPVTTVELEVKYPSIPPVIAEYLSHVLNTSLQNINVTYANDPIHEEVEDAGELLNTHELGQADSNAQSLVGQARISSLLKELNKSKHIGDQYKGVNEQLLATDLPEDTKAVIMQALDIASKSTLGSSPIKFINPGD